MVLTETIVLRPLRKPIIIKSILFSVFNLLLIIFFIFGIINIYSTDQNSIFLVFLLPLVLWLLIINIFAVFNKNIGIIILSNENFLIHKPFGGILTVKWSDINKFYTHAQAPKSIWIEYIKESSVKRRLITPYDYPGYLYTNNSEKNYRLLDLLDSYLRKLGRDQG